MQLIYQFGLIFAGSDDEIPFALVSFLLSLIGLALYQKVRAEQRYASNGAERYQFTNSQKKQLRWLKITDISLLTGFPALLSILPFYLRIELPSSQVWIWGERCCFNLPGIIFFLQVIVIRLSRGLAIRLPKYL